MDKIPPEFTRHGGTVWNNLASRWFFCGLDKSLLKPKDGIDMVDALTHLKYCIESWEPKHEHKQAGVAYLMSLWFEEVKA